MRRTLVPWLTVALCAAGCGASCGETAGCRRSGSEVRLALASSPTTLDWNRSHESSAANYPVLQAMMRGLTTLDSRDEPAPGLAESWEVRREGQPERQVYTFHLRPHQLWSDGRTPLTARDFVVGWRRGLLGADGADFEDIVGAREVLAAAARSGPPEEVEQATREAMKGFAVEALDATTLRVTLRSPRSYFLARIASAYPFFPAPRADLEGRSEKDIRAYFDEPRAGAPRVLGAFTVERWDRPARRIILDANPYAPTSQATGSAVSRLTLREQALAPLRYEQCQVDFLFLDNPASLFHTPADVHRAPLMSTYWLGMNALRLSRPLREAIARGVDRPSLTRGLLPQARSASSFLPPGMPGRAEGAGADTSSFQPAAARAALARSGYRGEELTLLVRGSSTFLPEVGIADALRQQLGALGIRVRIVTTSNFVNDIRTADRRATRHDLFLQRTGADYPHPQTMFTPFLPMGNNYTEWEKLEGGRTVARFQALLDEGAAAEDAQSMQHIYAQAERLLVEEEPVVVPLYYPDRYYRVRPWIEGLSVDPFNFLTLASMRLSEAER